MIKELVKDQELLSKPAQPATIDDLQVAEDLRDTMASLDNCACLAANQIGSDKAVIAYGEDDGDVRVMFNPKIKAAMRPYRTAESCLSLDEPHEVTRYFMIKVAYEAPLDGKLVERSRKLVDWEAQVVQHAIDHCTGKLV
jgi:peptide deformylase